MDELDRYLDFDNQQYDNETSIDFNRSKNNSYTYSRKDHTPVILFTPMKKKNNLFADTTPISFYQKLNQIKSQNTAVTQELRTNNRKSDTAQDFDLFSNIQSQQQFSLTSVNDFIHRRVIQQPIKKEQEYHTLTVFHQINTNSAVKKKTIQKEEVENETESCNCKKSQCLKLYCECLRRGDFCKNCNCQNCFNVPGNPQRQKIVDDLKKKNPNIFQSFIQTVDDKKKVHNKGCNCKRSNCLKNYCECHQFGIKCSENCKCFNCKNVQFYQQNLIINQFYV